MSEVRGYLLDTPYYKNKFVSIIVYTLFTLSGNSGRLTWVRLQQLHEQRYPVLQVHAAGSFRVSVIHRTLTWTTGSFKLPNLIEMSLIEFILLLLL